MKALLWYMRYGHLGVEKCDDLEDAAQTQASIDDEWACIGVEVFNDDGTREWHSYNDGTSVFSRRVSEIEDERYQSWSAADKERPVQRVLAVAAPPEIEKGGDAVVEFIRDGDDGDALALRWSALVGKRLRSRAR